MRINKHSKKIFIKISHRGILEYTENNNFPIAVALVGCGTGKDELLSEVLSILDACIY
jgi:hypothetical protein